MTIEPTLINLLNTIYDPFLDLSGSDMHLIPAVEHEGQNLQITLQAGFPCDFLELSYKPLLLKQLELLYPQYAITLTITSFIKAHKTQLTGKGLRNVKNTIAIASGKGGVGKSTVTINLATALAKQGARVGVLDADIYGPSIPVMLGKTDPVQLRDNAYVPIEAHGIQAMSIGYLIEGDQALIWRGPMLAKSFIQMLDGTAWDELDYLFIDLPPGTGDVQLTLVQKIPLTSAIVVTTPQNVATLDAQKALDMFNKTGIDVLGVVENMSTHVCSECGHEEAIFGSGGAQALSETHHTPLLGQLPLDSQVREHSDAGRPVALLDNELGDSFTKTALRAAIHLAAKPINYADKFPRVVVE